MLVRITVTDEDDRRFEASMEMCCGDTLEFAGLGRDWGWIIQSVGEFPTSEIILYMAKLFSLLHPDYSVEIMRTVMEKGGPDG